MAARLFINVTNTEFDSLHGKDLLKLVMRRFLGADECILSMVVTHLPSPIVAQRYRFAHLYKGPLDDEVATAIKNCDPNGPLMMYVSKMIPSDGGRFIAFGRVFSGTVRPNQKVRILGPNYEKGSLEDLFVKPIQNTVVMMGRKVEPIADCPCGNIIGVTGIDHFLVKTGTLTTSEDAHAMAAMKFSVSPVVRVTVTVKHAENLPRLIDGLSRLAKTDPAIQVYTEDTGENILATVGELQLEICLNDLREYANCEFTTSNPIVSYRETIIEKSAVCLSKSPNKHNRIYMYAEPLGLPLTEALENKVIAPNMDLPQRVEKFAEFGWSGQEVRNVWAFGPAATSNTNNMLVNATTGVQYLNEMKDYIVSSFQWTSNQGVLCEEPMRGVKFVLHDVTTIADAVHRGGGQIIPASRRCMFAAELSAQPRLVEPYYLADITCPEQSLGGVHSALGRRRGTIIEEQMANRGLFNVKAYLPVMESFGFNSFLAVETSGRAFLQMSFDHWELVDSDPLLPSSKGRDIVRSIRVRKGLKEDIPIVVVDVGIVLRQYNMTSNILYYHLLVVEMI
ncbi:hypothetical protein DFA_05009 [Cavenderia fasciculata]|uniref:Elongation factor 2 n=1 Tax=Cavenderia fasciculata TaxID=261658 RepID=F4PMY6_CACFS|nr:uncharacterized protein DFA_05009 [Cavenderia fasciculata]EGG22879.1 hypothetical protein DFA_05009 [Cavenderia fasciculata]|eukprot:XP_004360730.1 hypothetical protein DFA_05009 [Cavenderia fasciculata]